MARRMRLRLVEHAVRHSAVAFGGDFSYNKGYNIYEIEVNAWYPINSLKSVSCTRSRGF